MALFVFPTKSPDRAILGKMLRLASQLGAVVQGDEGEVYSEATQLPEDVSAQVESFRRRQRRFVITAFVIFGLSIALVIIKVILGR